MNYKEIILELIKSYNASPSSHNDRDLKFKSHKAASTCHCSIVQGNEVLYAVTITGRATEDVAIKYLLEEIFSGGIVLNLRAPKI